MKRALLTLTVLALLAAGDALGRNIDLVTLPPRAKVQITIYNSEDLTLVKEVRAITFKKGMNRLQFSWANTLIDPTSVYMRPLEHEADVEVQDTTFPGDRPQVLIWNVDSKIEGQVPVEVTYFTSGIGWYADYVMITNPDETQASFDGYVTVTNNSGEDYEGAEVRLVVGVVNLVEKIRQLAQQQGAVPADGNRNRAMEESVSRAETAPAPAAAPAEMPAKAPPRVVKEGLSEYFIFTIDGLQMIKNGWSQRMISFKAPAVTFDILYRLRPHQYGPAPVRFFLLANDAEHKMGESPLPDGIIRVFRENGKDGLNFFCAQQTKYIPIKEKIELNVGVDRQITYERVALDLARQNFIYRDTPNGPVVSGWDETRKWQEEVKNWRAKPIKLEFRHVLAGDVEFKMEAPAKLFDYQTVEYTMDIPSRKPMKWLSEGTFHLGENQKQQRIRLLNQN
jgi:hypothetical protein